MNKSFALMLSAGLLALSMTAPVFADHHKHYRNYNNGYYGRDWNSQRSYLRSNMRRMHGRVAAQRERELDAMMRAQFQAYHNNRWNGQYGWSSYSDPYFLDYVHTRNPGLLNTVMNYIR